MLENVKVSWEMRTRGGGNDFFSCWQLDFMLVSTNRLILGNQHRDGYVQYNSEFWIALQTAGSTSATKIHAVSLPYMCKYKHAPHLKRWDWFLRGWGCKSFHRVTSRWLFFTQLHRRMFWWHDGVEADMTWLKMHPCSIYGWSRSKEGRLWVPGEALCRELHLILKYAEDELIICLNVWVAISLSCFFFFCIWCTLYIWSSFSLLFTHALKQTFTGNMDFY